MSNDQEPDRSDTGLRTRAPRLLSVSDAAAAYRLVHGRIDTLVRGRTEIAEMTVPACPGWAVRQTVAHLVGVAQDVVALNMEGVASESWTQAQVDRLSQYGIDELLDLWAESIDPLTQRLTQGAPELSAGQLVFDVLTHEHDIRGALSEPGSRAGDLSYQAALGFLATMFDLNFRDTGSTAMRLTTPSIGTVQLGDPVAATDQLVIEVSDFEALRAFGGRRSVRQLVALPWHGDPPNPPPAANNQALRPPTDDLVE